MLTLASEGSQEGLPLDAGRHGPEQLEPNRGGDEVSVDDAAGLKPDLLMDAVSAEAACMRLPASCIRLQALCPKPLGALHRQNLTIECLGLCFPWTRDHPLCAGLGLRAHSRLLKHLQE